MFSYPQIVSPINKKKTSFHLFHYTDIDSLKAILNNKTFRFTDLSKLDDMQEKESIQYNNRGYTTFVSCWTSASKESIPMWYLYSKGKPENMIRIELPANPFTEETAEEITDNQEPERCVNGLSIIRRYKNNSSILFKVEYTDIENDKKLKPIESSFLGVKQSKEFEIFITEVFPSLGYYKNNYWSFQREYRYILWYDGDDRNKIGDYLYLKLRDEIIKKMKIVTGPQFNKYEELLTLLVPYGIECKKSILTGKVKIN